MDRREEQPGAAGAGAAPALDFTVENVEKVRGPWGRGGWGGGGCTPVTEQKFWARTPMPGPRPGLGARWDGAPGTPGTCCLWAGRTAG